jgi:hypothetical protein
VQIKEHFIRDSVLGDISNAETPPSDVFSTPVSDAGSAITDKSIWSLVVIIAPHSATVPGRAGLAKALSFSVTAGFSRGVADGKGQGYASLGKMRTLLWHSQLLVKVSMGLLPLGRYPMLFLKNLYQD